MSVVISESHCTVNFSKGCIDPFIKLLWTIQDGPRQAYLLALATLLNLPDIFSLTCSHVSQLNQ